MSIPHIHTNDGLTVVIKGRPYTVAKDDKSYEDAVALLRGGTEAEFDDLLTRVQRKLRQVLELAPDMEYSGGAITYQGEVLHNYAADRLIGMIEAGVDHTPLSKFLAKLQSNPSKRVVDNLYEFLEKGRIPLTSDGDFLAYKAVRGDFMDIHSGTFLNGVGSVCTMPRNKVDEDPNRTCSAGLHVCSFDYLPHFSHANGHVMIVKVDPANVVAIPADYNATKMRVSQYVVIDEVQDYYAQRKDVLGEVGADSGVMDPLFTVFDTGDEEVTSFYTLAEAKLQAKRIWEDDGSPDWLVTYVEDAGGFVVYEYPEAV
jgi:hypothetical protein